MIDALLTCLGTWQRCKRGETVNFPMSNYMQTNSCFMKWPWTFGVSLRWKTKTLAPALHHKLWGYNTHTSRITARNQDYIFCFKPQCSCYSLSQISWSNIERRVNDHISRSQYHLIAAHRSKRQPEFFPSYFKPHFEGWRRWGLRLLFWQDMELLHALRGGRGGGPPSSRQLS